MISGYGKSCEDAMQVSDIWETPGPTEEQVKSCGEERGGIDGHGRVSKGSGQDLDPRSDWDPLPSKMSTCFLSLGSYELLDPGGGHSNPLQYSCLENLIERGAWQATVHRLKRRLKLDTTEATQHKYQASW